MLTIYLAYATSAMIATKGGDFNIIQDTPNAEIIMGQDIVVDKEFPLFSGLIDGRGNTLSTVGQTFERMEGAYIRNVTIAASHGNFFAENALNCRFVSVQFVNVAFDTIEQTSVEQSRISGEVEFVDKSNQLELLGSAVLLTGVQFVASSSNDIFSNSLVEVHDTFSIFNTMQGATIKMARYLLEAEDATDVAAIATEMRSCSLSDVDFSFSLKNCQGNLNGISPLLAENEIFNISTGIAVEGANTHMFGVAEHAENNDINELVVYWVADESSQFETFAGAFGQLDNGNTMSLITIFLNGKIVSELSQDPQSPVVAGAFIRLPADGENAPQLSKVTVNFDFEVVSQQDITIAALGIESDGTLTTAIAIGVLTYNLIEDEAVEFLYFSQMVNQSSGGSIVDSYNELSLIAFASQATAQVLMSGFVNLCDNCSLLHGGAYNNLSHFTYSISGANVYRLAGAVAYVTGTAAIQDFYVAMTLDIFAIEIGRTSGFIGQDFAGTITDVQLQFNVSVFNVKDGMFAMAFWRFNSTSTAISGMTALCLQCGHFLDMGLALFGTVEGENIFVDCELLGVEPSIKQCKTTEEMKSGETLSSLGSKWARYDTLNLGYPYSMDAFVHVQQNGSVDGDWNSTYFEQTEWHYDTFSGLLFANSYNSYCRGSCDGFGFSPAAFECNNENKLCFVEEPLEQFYSEVCYSFNLGTSCFEGQTTCDATYIFEGLSCKEKCKDCGNGYCVEQDDNFTCQCDLYYSGNTCEVFTCDLQVPSCYGKGSCIVYDGEDMCQCNQAAAIYEDGSCLNEVCPGLSGKSGICLADGAHCFSGYTPMSGKCGSLVSIVVPSVIAGILVLVVIGILCWYLLKRRNASSEEHAMLLDDEE